MLSLFWAMLNIGTAEWLFDMQATGNQLSPFVLDDVGSTTQQQQWVYTRSILGYTGKTERFKYEVALEGINMQVAGDQSDLGLTVSPSIFRNPKTSLDGTWLLPRAAKLQTRVGETGLSFGIQSFDWGLGILSNSGTQPTRFGVNQQGNVYGRLALSRKMDDIHLFWAIDAIVRDENALWTAGDRAAQSILGIQRKGESYQAGLLTGLRYQQDRLVNASAFGQTESFVVPVDVYLQTEMGSGLTLSAEGVGVAGRSNRLVNEATKGGDARVRYFGGVTRIEHDKSLSFADLQTLFEVGGASGDADTGDGVARTFSLHSDYNVGLLLYDEVLPRIQANTVDRLADPDLSAQAPSGLQYAVPQGGVSGSTYLQVCSTLEAEKWLARAAWLEGFSAVPSIDLYQTALAGGYPTDAMGAVAESKHLGSELDLRLHLKWRETIFIGADAGYFMPGSALPTMAPTTKVMASIQVLSGGQK